MFGNIWKTATSALSQHQTASINSQSVANTESLPNSILSTNATDKTSESNTNSNTNNTYESKNDDNNNSDKSKAEKVCCVVLVVIFFFCLFP